VSLSYQFATFQYFSIKEWPDQTIHAFIWSKSHSNPCENSGSADYLKALSKKTLSSTSTTLCTNMVRMLSNNLLGLQLNDVAIEWWLNSIGFIHPELGLIKTWVNRKLNKPDRDEGKRRIFKGEGIDCQKQPNCTQIAAWNGSYVMNYEPAVMKIIAACNGQVRTTIKCKIAGLQWTSVTYSNRNCSSGLF
jgi:hypothetical protein